jgi:hypothetical protein
MPHANIWIRGENWEHWKTISNKSEIVNAVLDQSRKTGLSFPEKVAEKIKVGDVLQGDTPRRVTKIEEIEMAYNPKKKELLGKPVGDLLSTKPETGAWCKNGHLLQPGRDRCSAKGCKYS